MKKFVIKTAVAVLTTVALFVIAFCVIPSGRIGDVYPRVSSPLQQSLVIGTSRAAQAVNPAIVNAKLQGIYSPTLYNFAFHLDASSYNEVYENAIYKKLAPYDGHCNLFVLTVDPWALRTLDSIPQELALRSYSARPNMEHIVKNFSRSWFSPLPTHSFVNENGRTEVDYEPKTKKEWEKRVEMRLVAYKDMAKNYSYSHKSQLVLERLILNLGKRGEVCLVRIPTSQPMKELEHKICPEFDIMMKAVAQKHGIAYYNFAAADYATTDGNHLTQKEGNRFSAALADSILQHAEKQASAN